MTATLKPFNNFDWDGFAGASPLPDGTPPQIGEVHDWILIVTGDDTDVTATAVQLFGPDGDETWDRSYDTVTEALAAGVKILRAASADDVKLYLVENGFDRIN